MNLPRWQRVALLLLIAWLYASILARLFLQWINDPNFSHGVFVPLFAFFVLWQDRKKLAAIVPVSSWSGLPLVLLSMLVLVLGVLGADIFLPRVSLLILLAGLIILFQGWTFFRAVLFPWAFLILMIPIPSLIISRVTFPLQLLASKLATVLLRLAGVPVLLEGNLITLPAMQLDVAEACSGIRSLLTLVTLAIIYGYLLETRRWVRVVLALSALPIAVVANGFRVFGTGLLVQYWDPDKAMGFFHTFEGWLIFVVALIMLFAVHRLICLIWKIGPAAPRKIAHLEERPAGEIRTKAGSLRFGIVAVPMLATAIGLQAHSSTEIVKHVGSLSSQIGGWTGTDIPIDKQTLDILGPGEHLLRDTKTRASLNLGSISSFRSFPRKGLAIPSIRRTTACRARDGFRFRGRGFSLRVRMDLQSPLTATWFQRWESGNWCCTGFRLTAAWWPASGRPSII